MGLRRKKKEEKVTENAHDAVDGGGGGPVAGGGVATALEAAEEGEVGAEELGLVVGVVGHVVAVAAEVEVVDGAAVPEHGAGLLAAGPVGAAVVAVAREELGQPRPRAAVPRQLRHVRPEQRHRAPHQLPRLRLPRRGGGCGGVRLLRRPFAPGEEGGEESGEGVGPAVGGPRRGRGDGVEPERRLGGRRGGGGGDLHCAADANSARCGLGRYRRWRVDQPVQYFSALEAACRARRTSYLRLGLAVRSVGSPVFGHRINKADAASIMALFPVGCRKPDAWGRAGLSSWLDF
jgi:hypothetical protein